jgi:hypothetical protein
MQWDERKIRLPDFTLDNVLVNQTLATYTTGAAQAVRLDHSLTRMCCRQLQSSRVLFLFHTPQWFLFSTIDSARHGRGHHELGVTVAGE